MFRLQSGAGGKMILHLHWFLARNRLHTVAGQHRDLTNTEVEVRYHRQHRWEIPAAINEAHAGYRLFGG